MSFTAPKQVQSVAASEMDKFETIVKRLHVDIPSALLSRESASYADKTIRFFSYAVHEALHLSEREEKISLRYSNGLNRLSIY